MTDSRTGYTPAEMREACRNSHNAALERAARLFDGWRDVPGANTIRGLKDGAEWQDKRKADPQSPYAIGDTVHLYLPNHDGSTTPGKVVAVLDLPGWVGIHYVVEVEIGAPDPLLVVRNAYGLRSEAIGGEERQA